MKALSEALYLTTEYTNNLINVGVSETLEKLWNDLPKATHTTQWSVLFMSLVNQLETNVDYGFRLVAINYNDNNNPIEDTLNLLSKIQQAVGFLIKGINKGTVSDNWIIDMQSNIHALINEAEALGKKIVLNAHPYRRRDGYLVAAEYDDHMNLISTKNAVYLDIIHDGGDDEHKLIGVKAIPPQGITIRHLLSCISSYVEMYNQDETAIKAEMIDVINNPDL